MKKKIIIALILVLLIVALVWWKWDDIKAYLGMFRQKAIETTGDEQQGKQQGTGYKNCEKPPFRLGCSGERIRTIQKALNKLHNAGLETDGRFGPKTEKALIDNGYGPTVELEDIQKMTEELESR